MNELFDAATSFMAEYNTALLGLIVLGAEFLLVSLFKTLREAGFFMTPD